MSLYSVTEDLKQSLRSARRAILGRGGEISATAGLKDLPDAIYKIPADASLAFQTDDSVAYQKIVPSGAEEYAQVAKVGGMTYKASFKNYISSFEASNNNFGGEVTINADNSITIFNPTGISGEAHLLYYTEDDEVSGRYFTSLNFPAELGASILTYYDDGYDAERYNELNSWIPTGDYHRSGIGTIIIKVPAMVEAYTFSLILADTDDIWEGLRDTKVTELVSEGANLLPPSIRKNVTNNGIAYTVLDDGTVIANGTATAQSNFAFQEMWRGEKITLTQGETYTLSGEPNGASADTYRLMMQDVNYYQNYYCGVPAVAKYTEYYAFIRIQQGITVNNLVFKPMFVRGSTAKPYSPYGTIVDTFPISAELRAFLADKGYGRGVSGYPNYIDYDRKVFVQNSGRLVLNGGENWKKGTSAETLYYIDDVISIGRGKMMCSHYITDNTGAISIDNNAWIANSGKLNITPVDYKTLDAWKTHLAELYASGNPVIVEYALVEPIEIDISAYLTDDNFIKVEGGGVIRAVNEYKQDAPSTINYITKVGT